MSDEAQAPQATPEATESTDQPVETIEESKPIDETTTNEAEQAEEVQEPDAGQPDLVADALAEQARLKEELEALKTAESNVFEQNALLQAELEDAKKLAKMAEENKDLQSQLEGIKRKAITDSLNLNDKMSEFVNGLSFEQLQTYAENAPRRKTILDEKNNGAESSDTDFEAWKLKMSKSRIVS